MSEARGTTMAPSERLVQRVIALRRAAGRDLEPGQGRVGKGRDRAGAGRWSRLA